MPEEICDFGLRFVLYDVSEDDRLFNALNMTRANSEIRGLCFLGIPRMPNQ